MSLIGLLIYTLLYSLDYIITTCVGLALPDHLIRTPLRLALLALCGIVVERSSYEASLLIVLN